MTSSRVNATPENKYLDALTAHVATLRNHLEEATSELESTLSVAAPVIDRRNFITGVVIGTTIGVALAALAPEVIIVDEVLGVMAMGNACMSTTAETVVTRGLAATMSTGGGIGGTQIAGAFAIASPLASLNVRGIVLRDLDIKALDMLIDSYAKGQMFGDFLVDLEKLEEGSFSEDGEKKNPQGADVGSLKTGGYEFVRRHHSVLANIELEVAAISVASEYFDQQPLDVGKVEKTAIPTTEELLKQLWILWLAALDDDSANILKIDIVGQNLVDLHILHDASIFEPPVRASEAGEPRSTLNRGWNSWLPEGDAVGILYAARKQAKAIKAQLEQEVTNPGD